MEHILLYFVIATVKTIAKEIFTPLTRYILSRIKKKNRHSAKGRF